MAFHEADWAALICDPPSSAWTELTGLYLKVAEKNGIDCYIGRKLPRMLGDAGVTDIRVRPSMHVHPLGDPRRMLMLQFGDNFKDQILAHGLLSADDFAVLKNALAAHLRDPGTTVFLGPYIQAWGRKPVHAVPRWRGGAIWRSLR